MDLENEEFFELFGNPMKMDGFDDCIIGVACRATSEPFIVYDKEKVIKKLIDMGMNEEEAEEYHEFNQACAWVGPQTPAFLIPI